MNNLKIPISDVMKKGLVEVHEGSSPKIGNKCHLSYCVQRKWISDFKITNK